jgi:RNA polymerase sigma-70 factor (ECF subfamily)
MILAPTAARDHDRDLARRAASGDRGAQRELFMAQRGAVHHALFRVLGNNREIEDLLQDSFFEIFRALPSFRGDSSLSRWCQTIAMRVAYRMLSLRRLPLVDLALVEDTVADGADTQRHLMLREATRRLYTALERIRAQHRIAFALVVVDGRSPSEVAELTGSSVSAVKTRVSRARKDLMKRASKDAVLAGYLSDLGAGGSDDRA